jgi:hypothetical protein
MSKTMKWIVGIVIGLVVVAAIVSAGFLVAGQWAGPGWNAEARAEKPWDGGRAMPRQEMPMRPYRGEFYRGNGGYSFSPLRMIVGGVFCLGFLALMVLGIIALGRVALRPSKPAAPAIPAAAPTPPPSLACPSCERPVQSDWRHCPYCGNDLPADPISESPPV